MVSILENWALPIRSLRNICMPDRRCTDIKNMVLFPKAGKMGQSLLDPLHDVIVRGPTTE